MLSIFNKSYFEHEWIECVLNMLLVDLEIKSDLEIYVQDCDSQHDGDWDQGVDGNYYINIKISSKLKYPQIWDINPELKHFYLRKTNTFNDCLEFFIYYAAHEMRHQWQEENPTLLEQVKTIFKCDDETDADIYASIILCKFRSQL